jgi:hypothetical protein
MNRAARDMSVGFPSLCDALVVFIELASLVRNGLNAPTVEDIYSIMRRFIAARGKLYGCLTFFRQRAGQEPFCLA